VTAAQAREAEAYEKLEGGTVRCLLCPHLCEIAEGRSGICGVRENEGGVLFARSYGICTSLAVDPIEKKPLYHFEPGSLILSVGSYGCNFRCPYCQNAEISQSARPGRFVSPEGLIALAESDGDSIGIAYTYNEPLIGFEFVRDCAELAHRRGLVNVLVSNGYIRDEWFRKLAPHIDAINLDIKSMSPSFYERLCRGTLEPVLQTARTAKQHCHLEVTNLVITDENDCEDELRELARWVGEELGRDTPIHFSRYHPAYRMRNPATAESALLRAQEIAAEYLDYVYLGNVLVPGSSDTTCHACGALAVRRLGYTVSREGLTLDGGCGSCGTVLPFAGSVIGGHNGSAIVSPDCAP
jgi:pyruvate formate lyase activating enzyme